MAARFVVGGRHDVRHLRIWRPTEMASYASNDDTRDDWPRSIRSWVPDGAGAEHSDPSPHGEPDDGRYGYYWAEAKPVLRIASGDMIDVDTLLTSTPAALERAGVPPEKIQASLKSIVDEVTGDRRGPGGHILTGPVYIEGAQPGDALEVKILAIEFPIDYGYNGCNGFMRPTAISRCGKRFSRSTRKTMTSEFKPGIVIPLKPFFGSMGVAPAPEAGRVNSSPPGRHAGNLDNRELDRRQHTVHSGVRASARCFEIGDGHAAQGDGEVDLTALETSLRGTYPAHGSERHAAVVAASRNTDRLHQHGV